MISHIVWAFTITFFIWFAALTFCFIILIKPKFIFRNHQVTHQQNIILIVSSLIFLFISSFLLGVTTFLMKVLNSIVIF